MIRAWGALAGATAVAIGAAAVLVFHASLFDPSRLHVWGPLNDQAGYVTAARRLVDTGELGSGLVLPAYVAQPGFRVYMPGHYLALAASYRLLGSGALPSLAPSLAAYVVAAVGLFLAGRRLYGPAAGPIAAALFVLFPPHVVFAFSAMAEMTLLAAAVLALTVFLHLSPRVWPLAMPVLVAVPFLFRETGALLLVPLALLLTRAARWRGALVAAGAASVALLYLLQRWQLATGKLAFPVSWVTEGRFNYDDALRTPPALPVIDWVAAVASNVERNVCGLAHILGGGGDPFESISVAILLALVALCLARGVVVWRRDPLPLGAGLLGVALLGLGVALYDVSHWKALRSLLRVSPVAALVLGGRVARWRVGTPARATLALGIVAATIWGSHTLSARAAASLRAGDQWTTAATRLLRQLDHDPTTVMVTPFSLGLDYAVAAYPVRWAFLPANDATWELLCREQTVGTLVIPESQLGTRLSPPAIERAGLVRRGRLLLDTAYVVFQAPRGS